MKRREFIIKGVTATAALCVTGCPTLRPKERRKTTEKTLKTRPNIVFIYADDLGYGDVGCYGATKVKTPNIDRLARQGRMFMDAHSPSAVCTPSRYSFLTGQYGWRVNCWGPLRYDRPLLPDTDRLTVPAMLKQHGYSTACVGKWHLGFGDRAATNWNKKLKPGPLELGFDYYFGVPLVNSHAPFVFVENHHVVGLDPKDPFILRKPDPRATPDPALPRSPVQVFPEKGGIERWSGAHKAHMLYRDKMVGTTLTAKAVSWLRNHHKTKKDDPFFLYLATTNIHHPFTPHPRFEGTSQCGRYGDFVHELDWIVGQVTETLDDLGVADNTLIIFTSDNGAMLNQGGKAAWQAGHRINGDLLGFKFGAWEGGHRVPFIARWPGHIQPGSRSDQLICSIDMMAAFSAIVGHSLGPDDGPDSFNVLPALTGEPIKPIRDHLVIAPARASHLSVRAGKWVYIAGQGSGGFGRDVGGPGAVAWTGEINSDITPEGTIKKDAPPQQLYDLEGDLSQAKNVIRDNPAEARKLKALLKKIKTAKRSAPPAN